MNSLNELREELYSQLASLDCRHKHQRELTSQTQEQIYRCLELLESLENELAKLKIMENSSPDFVYQETVERGY